MLYVSECRWSVSCYEDTDLQISHTHTHTHTCTYTLTKITHIPHCSGLQQSIGLNTPL